MIEWYYGQSGQQQGPFDEATLRSHIAAGKVAATDLVWREGMAEWLPLSQVAELSGSAQPSPYATPGTNPVSMAPAPQYAAVPPTSGLAIASLVCGILALITSCVYGGGIVFGIPAAICGHMANKRIGDPQNPTGGKGMALAGLICGYIGSLISIVIIGVLIFLFTAGDGLMKDLKEEAQQQQKELQEEIQKQKEEAQEQMEEAQENAR